jgi:hypothetical protein
VIALQVVGAFFAILAVILFFLPVRKRSGRIVRLTMGSVFAVLAAGFMFPMVTIVLMMAVPSFDDLWYDDDLVKRLRAVSSKGGLVRGEDVTAGIGDVLPVGMPAENATRYLQANGFVCGGEGALMADGQLACKRQAGRFPCGETWVVRLTWAPDQTIADRRATLDVVCV